VVSSTSREGFLMTFFSGRLSPDRPTEVAFVFRTAVVDNSSYSLHIVQSA